MMQEKVCAKICNVRKLDFAGQHKNNFVKIEVKLK